MEDLLNSWYCEPATMPVEKKPQESNRQIRKDDFSAENFDDVVPVDELVSSAWGIFSGGNKTLQKLHMFNLTHGLNEEIALTAAMLSRLLVFP
jgi:hypothetical protein